MRRQELIDKNRAAGLARRRAAAANGGGTGKATNGDNKTQKSSIELLRYPKDRVENDTDYLKLSIAQYRAPFALGGNPLDGLVTYTKIKGTGTGTEKKPDKDNFKISTEKFKNISNATGTAANRESLKSPKYQIILPIPQQLSDISAIDWTDGKLNPIEAYGLAATASIINAGEGGIINSIDAATQIGQQLFDTASGALMDDGVKKAIVAALSGAAVGSLGGTVTPSQIVSRATGQVFNPNLELLFNGVNLRVFPFTFEFFPRNKEEADEVKLILRRLKYSMLPEKGGAAGIFISAPYIFQLEYMKGRNKHPFLNRFKPMALTNMSVNYTGSNTYSTFYDGSPTHIKVQLLFKELNPIYKEDYDELGENDFSVGY